MKILAAATAILALLTIACDPFSQAENTIQVAIDQLTQASKDWQTTLTQLENNLIAQGQSTISNEVTQLAQRGIATAGTEIKCTVDFVGNRMQEGLQGILAKLKNRPAPPLKQYFCEVIPTEINLGLDPSRRTELDFYGYNLDAAGVNVSVMDDRGAHPVPADLIATPTHYLMTVNISAGNGVQFSPTGHQMIFTFPIGQEVHAVNIVTCGNIGQVCCPQNACNKGACSGNICGVFSISQDPYIQHDVGGGNGGTPFAPEECPAGAVAIGFQGKSGDRIDNIELLCSNLNEDGTLGPISGMSPHGGNGGQPFNQTCQSGGILIGMYGDTGSGVDRLGGQCSSPTSILLSGPTSKIGPWGGNGGNNPFDETCGAGSVMTGLVGRSGSELDHIGFLCRKLVFK
jgi:hypothetical protein